ncbi:hypothetical protein DVH24_038402 [Malus domestica]|uniref:Uncharacterized protein n=1 Tax=Malus domestica TaxID=3750 RepID=A0A498K9K3_MALDO|nr:hypothetical protein DVH24_038402 [Malus domestica]
MSPYVPYKSIFHHPCLLIESLLDRVLFKIITKSEVFSNHVFDVTSQSRLCRSKILSVLGPGHTLTVLFLGTHTRTSQWVTHPGNALVRICLTSEFRWNPKPVSSQKASCYKRWACTYKTHHILSVDRREMLHMRNLKQPL